MEILRSKSEGYVLQEGLSTFQTPSPGYGGSIIARNLCAPSESLESETEQRESVAEDIHCLEALLNQWNARIFQKNCGE